MTPYVLLLCAGLVTLAAAEPSQILEECWKQDVSSWAYRYHEQRVNVLETGTATSMTVESEHYDDESLCKMNETFGFTETKLWVSHGCRATFTVCYNQAYTFDAKLNAMITELKTTKGELKTTQGELKTTQGELKQTKNDLKAKLDEQVKTNVKVQNCMSRRAGFMSVISSTFNGGHVATIARNQPIVFDKVIYSSGGGYDNQTGLFTCSVPGEYHFSVHSISAQSQYIYLELRLNSNAVATLYVQGGSDVGSGTEGAVLHLNKNDVVSVASAPCCISKFYQDVNLVQSNVFTGHLIHSDDCLV